MEPSDRKPRIDVNLRPRREDDVPFVTAAWVRASRYCAPYSGVQAQVRDYHVHRGIERLWRARDTTWLVACWPQDLNIVYGFLCGEATDVGPVLHWCYVRKQFQHMGVGTALLDEFLRGGAAPQGYYTSDTADVRALLQAATPDLAWTYDPWLLWEGAWRKT